MIRIEIDMLQTRTFLSIWIVDLSSLYTQKITLTCTNNFHQFFFFLIFNFRWSYKEKTGTGNSVKFASMPLLL